MKRVTTLRQEARPSKYSSLVVDHHISAAHWRQWELRMQGFILGIVLAGLMCWLSLR